jgi:hypothetical protein
MGVLIHTHSARIESEGTVYEASVHGAERADGTWTGWLEFRAVPANGTIYRTGQETSQPSRHALEYWAGGLEPVYLEGALVRAFRNARGTNANAQHAPPPGP